MARVNKDKDPKTSEEQEEMTVVILRFRGGGETLRKGFDTVSQALNALAPLPALRRLAAPPVEDRADPNEGDTDSGSIDVEAQLDENENDESDPTRQRSAPRPPEFLNDFDLSPEGQVAWKEYAAEKNPQTLSDKYLVAGAWLTLHRGQQVFSASHVFTCFRAMHWEEQKDFTQPMRKMKKSRSYFAVPKRGEWKMTGLGLDAVGALGAKATE